MTNITKYQSTFIPQQRLRTKYIIYLVLIMILIWLPTLVFGYFIIQDEASSPDETFAIFFNWVTGITLGLTIVLIPFIYLYYKSITYEIVQDEIHVFRGIITKTRKIVPYRTITNLDVKRGIFDRMLGLGTVEIQTAGYSANKTGPEERMDGLPADDVDAIQTYLIDRVRRVRGSAGAITHDPDDEDAVLHAILVEIRKLREYLIKD